MNEYKKIASIHPDVFNNSDSYSFFIRKYRKLEKVPVEVFEEIFIKACVKKGFYSYPKNVSYSFKVDEGDKSVFFSPRENEFDQAAELNSITIDSAARSEIQQALDLSPK